MTTSSQITKGSNHKSCLNYYIGYNSAFLWSNAKKFDHFVSFTVIKHKYFTMYIMTIGAGFTSFDRRIMTTSFQMVVGSNHKSCINYNIIYNIIVFKQLQHNMYSKLWSYYRHCQDLQKWYFDNVTSEASHIKKAPLMSLAF